MAPSRELDMSLVKYDNMKRVRDKTASHGMIQYAVIFMRYCIRGRPELSTFYIAMGQ